jgi:hypothetical protein
MNSRNDLDESLNYCKLHFELHFEFAQFQKKSRLPNLFSHFNLLLGKEVPKLLENCGVCVEVLFERGGYVHKSYGTTNIDAPSMP